MPYARPIKCEKQGRNIYFHYAYAESQIQITLNMQKLIKKPSASMNDKISQSNCFKKSK